MTADRDLDGCTLAHDYYEQAVRPLLLVRWPALPHAAGRLGTGSDVLGLDDATSRDHDWGLRLSLFIDAAMIEPVSSHLDTTLPNGFRGFPTRFAFTGHSSPRHHIEVDSARGFAIGRLGVDPLDGMPPLDWLSLTGQAVLEVTAGPVFADTTGELTTLRDVLHWYPDDLWRYVLACDWLRIEEELPLMGRAGERGDDLGSRVIAARIADMLMHLAFLLERRWAPYAKWRGTLFTRLTSASQLAPLLAATLGSPDWRVRQAAVCDALDILLTLQQDAGLPTPGPATVPFWGRPFRQPNEAVASALLAGIADPEVRALPRGHGSAEQRTDNVALLVDPGARRRLVGC